MLRLFSAVTVLAFAAPAVAGDLALRNGQGTWTPTQCRMPVAPAGPWPDAQTLNAAQSALVQAVDQYNLCLRNEAERDLQSANQVVIESVRRLQQQALDVAQNFPPR